MMLDIAVINLNIAVAGLVISIIGLGLSLSEGFLEKKTKLFFASFFIVLFIYVFSDLLGQLLAGRPGEKWILFAQIALFIESFSSSVLTVQITHFLFFKSGRKLSGNPFIYIVLALWGVYVIFLMITGFNGAFYYFDEGNNYQRGPLYPLLLIPPILIMIINLYALWKERGRLSPKQRRAFLLYTAVPALSMILEIFFYGIYFIILGTSVGAMVMLGFIASDQIERYKQKEEENVQLKIDILLAQIQPHFLYNSLATIRHLCDGAPEAERAVSLFSAFLRHNMDSLTMNRPIPFSKELEHVKAYLELEKLRFGDDLTVEYALETKDFSIATLTLQPLVENAVRYGVRGNEDGRGRVRISSRDCTDHIEVSIEDDGPGFDPEEKKEDGRQHVGIMNVRERLKQMNRGELRISSGQGKGSIVTIILPKEAENADTGS